MKTIAFYQFKGGVGKTTSAVNIAYLASKHGVRTVLWDLDPQGAASWYFPPKSKKKASDISNLLRGKPKIADLIQETKYPDLDIIPSDISLRHVDVLMDKNKAKRFMSNIISVLSEDYGILIIDCAPSLSTIADQLFELCDHLYLPIVPAHLPMFSYDQVFEFFKEQDLAKKKLRPFFTMVDRRKKLHRDFVESPPVKLRRLSPCVVPYSADVEKMGLHRAPIATFSPSSVAAKSYESLWQEIKQQNKL